MELVEYPQALPGSCKICGSATKSPFIDTGSYEEFHGAIYYCHECAGQFARLLGFLHPDEFKALTEEKERLVVEVFEQKLRIDGLEKAIAGLTSAGYSQRDSSSVVDRVLPDSEVVSTGAEEGEASLGSGEGTSIEPSEQQGLADVHSIDVKSSDSGFKLSI